MQQVKKDRDSRTIELIQNDPAWRDYNAQVVRLEWVLEGGDPAEEEEEAAGDCAELPDGTAVPVEDLINAPSNIVQHKEK